LHCAGLISFPQWKFCARNHDLILPAELIPYFHNCSFQGRLGDCWFLSAVAVLTEMSRISEVIITPAYNEEGIYTIRFCIQVFNNLNCLLNRFVFLWVFLPWYITTCLYLVDHALFVGFNILFYLIFNSTSELFGVEQTRKFRTTKHTLFVCCILYCMYFVARRVLVVVHFSSRTALELVK
jgi:hypothetical protein